MFVLRFVVCLLVLWWYGYCLIFGCYCLGLGLIYLCWVVVLFSWFVRLLLVGFFVVFMFVWVYDLLLCAWIVIVVCCDYCMHLTLLLNCIGLISWLAYLLVVCVCWQLVLLAFWLCFMVVVVAWF